MKARPETLLIGLIFALLVALAIRQVGSLDIGFHLEAGDHLLAGKGWPSTDPFSYTMRAHRYVDTTWGYQVIVALLDRGFGAAGLVAFHASLALAMFLLVHRTMELRRPPSVLAAALLLAGVLASEMRFETRPETLSYSLLALELFWLHRHAETRGAPLRAIPLLHWIWANCHSLWVLGIAAQAAFAAGLVARDRRLDRRLAKILAASVAVSFLTPYGWRGVLFPFTLLTRFRSGNPFAESIGEFVSPLDLRFSEQMPFQPAIPLAAFRALVVCALLAAVLLLKTRQFPALLVLVMFGALGARMIRNMPLFAIAALPGIAWGFADLRVRSRRRRRSRPARLARAAWGAGAAGLAVLALVLLLWVVNDGYYLASRRPERFGWGWNGITLPIDAARFAERVGLRSPMLNHLNFGGFLMRARAQPVFIDGRLEVAGERFYLEYNQALSSPEALEACVSRYGIGWIVFPYATNPKLLGRLSGDPRWRLAYFDAVAAIFVRSGPGAEAWVDPSVAAPSPGKIAAGDLAALPGLGPLARRGRGARILAGLLRRERFPSDDFNRGLFHYYRGEMERAGTHFAAAIAASDGRYYEIYNNLGSVLYRLRRYDEAARCYEIVLAEAPYRAGPANRSR